MQRHPGLHPLSDDHHKGLVQARHLSRAGEPDSQLSPREIARGFLRFWDEGGQAHFRKEEELLLPFYSRFGDVGTVEVINLLLQHIDLRRRAHDLRQQLEAGEEPSSADMQEFGRLFHEHIRHEERVVFPMLEKTIPDEVLRTLGSLLK